MAKKGTAKKRGNCQRKGKKRERYTTFDVVQLIREKKITRGLELINFAEMQKNEGKTVLSLDRIGHMDPALDRSRAYTPKESCFCVLEKRYCFRL